MTYTENYELNQWQKSDRIMMEDFNSDNAKIDAALAGLSTAAGNVGTELLQTITISTSAVTQTVSLPTIDWSKYHYVRLDFQLTGSASIIYVQPNGLTSGLSYVPFSSVNVDNPRICFISCGQPCSIFFIPAKDGSRKVNCLALGTLGGWGYASNLTFSQLTNLKLTSNTSSWPITGGTIKIWGIK